MFRKIIFTAVLAIVLAMAHMPLHASDYIIGPGDVIKITVYGHEDLTTVERVSGSGTITFPLVGQLSVAGVPISSLSKNLERMLSDGYIVSPQVSVFIEEFRSQKAVIMGEVVKPGLYELKGRTTFLELVSIASGVTRDAGNSAIVKRKIGPDGRQSGIIKIDLNRLIREGDTSLDFEVIDGDSIYIPKAGTFYVTGEVRNPDEYKHKEDTTVIKAITLAGGFTDKAAPKKVKIIRKIEGVEQIFSNVNMDEYIYPEDIVVVPESFF